MSFCSVGKNLPTFKCSANDMMPSATLLRQQQANKTVFFPASTAQEFAAIKLLNRHA
jgi:hypothetical protein